MVADVANGACMPKRGSGPRTTVFTVPSEFVTTLVPSSLRTHCVDSPPGSVVVSLWSPFGRTSTAYVVVRPSEVVFATLYPPSNAVRTNVWTLPAASVACVSKPTPSYTYWLKLPRGSVNFCRSPCAVELS